MGEDRLAKVTIDGTAVKGTNVTSIEVSESLDRLDMLRMDVLVGPDLAGMVACGAPFKVELLDNQGATKRTLTGDVVEVSVNFTTDGLSITVQGLSTLHRLRTHWTTKVHEGTHSDVVGAIAKANGLTVDAQGVDGTSDFTFQANEEDAIVVNRLAKLNNYAVRVDEKKLHFTRTNAAASGADITISAALADGVRELRVSRSIVDVISKVTVMGYDPKKAEWVKTDSQATSLKKISGGKTGVDVVKAAIGEVVYLFDNTNIKDVSSAKALAAGELQRRAEKFVQGRIVCHYLPTARSGGKITLKDFNKAVDGAYIMREVTHSISDGDASTTIEFLSDSLPAGA